MITARLLRPGPAPVQPSNQRQKRLLQPRIFRNELEARSHAGPDVHHPGQ